MAPAYEELDSLYKEKNPPRKDVTIARINCEDNYAICEEKIDVPSYPTLYFFKKGNKKPLKKFPYKRNVKRMNSWILDEIKEIEINEEKEKKRNKIKEENSKKEHETKHEKFQEKTHEKTQESIKEREVLREKRKKERENKMEEKKKKRKRRRKTKRKGKTGNRKK